MKSFRSFCTGVLILSAVAFSEARACQINSNGNGASCDEDIGAAVVILKTTQLSVNSANPFSLLPSAGVLSVADYTAGFSNVATVLTVTARANTQWGATMASTANFAAPCSSKPAGQLLWGKTTGTRATPLATTAAQLFTGSTNAATAGTTVDLFFRVNLGWTIDPPSICDLPLTFLINAP